MHSLAHARADNRSRRAWRLGSACALLALAVAGIGFLLTVYGRYRQLSPEAYTMFWVRRGWLWTHLTGGALTIVLGLVQFFNRWLQAGPVLHRWLGRLYLAGMAIGCAGAAGLIATSPAPLGIGVAFVGTALAWLTTAAAGVVAIRGGRPWLHRRWMVRNYLVTVAPITFRALIELPGMMTLAPPPTVIATLLWLSWLLPLSVCEAAYRIADRLPQHLQPAL